MDRRRLAKCASALVAATTFAIMAGCGGPTARKMKTGELAAGVEETGQGVAITTSVLAPGRGVRGDGDADNPSDRDGNGDYDGARIGGPDPDNDNPVPASYLLPDADDAPVFAYGSKPNPTAGGIVARVVTRYYAAASSADGATGCTLLLPSLARTLPNGVAEPAAPAYLRGAPAACPAVLSRIFRHFHPELAAGARVLAVRVNGRTARVVLASRTLRASSVYLERRGGRWWIEEVLAQPLP